MVVHRRHFLHLCSMAGVGTFAGCLDSSEESETLPPRPSFSPKTAIGGIGLAEQ